MEGEEQETEDYGKQAHIYAIVKVQFMYDDITSDEAFEAYWQIFQKKYKELTNKSIDEIPGGMACKGGRG